MRLNNNKAAYNERDNMYTFFLHFLKLNSKG